jgi:GntR family transcriptional regulator
MEIQQREHESLDRFSPVPLYQQLSEILSRNIMDGSLQPGDPLPSEFTLMKQYEVSRYVVRQTIHNLSRQGLVFTMHGRGSFVSYQRIDKYLDILQSYHEGMRKSGIEVNVEILNKVFIHPPEDVAAQLKISRDEELFYLERVAYVGGAPVNILIAYITLGTWGKEHLDDFSGGSLYDHLKRECGICLYRSRSYIEVDFAGEYESRLLKIARGTVLLRITGIVDDKEGNPIEYSRVIYPGSMFRFRFDSYMSDQAGDSKRYMLT